MSKIQRKYWKWDNSLSPKLFNLDTSLEELLGKGLITQDLNSDELDVYSLKENHYWKVKFYNHKVFYISFRDEFFSLHGDGEIWDLHYDEFCRTMSSYLDVAEDDKEGDQLYVVFRDGFVSIVMLIRWSNEIIDKTS